MIYYHASSQKLRRIAITGPESTGKSELSAQLARHFNTVFVPEYARYYIARLCRPYRPNDLWRIAQVQMALEDRYAQRYSKNGWLFCDTDMTVIKIWHEHAFGEMPKHLAQLVQQRSHSYDAYLLNNIDLDWQPDPQREHPHLRPYFLAQYRQTLAQYQTPFALISGKGNDRLQNALRALQQMLPQKET